MLCLANMRKVIKSEGKWLKRTKVNLKQLKLQRLFHEWTLEVKRKKCKRQRQQRIKRNVVLAIGAVLDRESLEMADFLYRKRL